MSKTDNHLMSQTELLLFADAMYTQLRIHKDEKIGLADWEIVDVWQLCTDELTKRLELIKTRDPDEIRKQCVHMANYLFFLWQKCNQVRSSKLP